jgi:hypothetical protein
MDRRWARWAARSDWSWVEERASEETNAMFTAHLWEEIGIKSL